MGRVSKVWESVNITDFKLADKHSSPHHMNQQASCRDRHKPQASTVPYDLETNTLPFPGIGDASAVLLVGSYSLDASAVLGSYSLA